MPRRSKTCVFAIQTFHTAPLSLGRIVPRVTIADVNYIHLTLQSNTTSNDVFLSHLDVKLNYFIGHFHLCFVLPNTTTHFGDMQGGGGVQTPKSPWNRLIARKRNESVNDTVAYESL